MLSVGAWLSLERLFGPHSFDLMSLDSNCQKMSTAILCPTSRPGPPPDPLGSTFSLIPYQLDTTVTCFHLLFFLGLFFATLSTKSFIGLSHSLFWIFDQDYSGGRPSRPSQSIDFFWARRVPVQSYFFLPSILENGSPSSAVGPLGVPMCLLVNIFAYFSQDLGKVTGDVPRVCTLMTLMATFVRFVVRGLVLKSLLCLPRLLTMQRLPNVSESLTMCSKPSLTRDRSPPLSEN